MEFVRMRGQKVLIKPDDKVEKVGSIYIPDAVDQKIEKGTVVSSAIEDLPENTRVIYDRALTISLKDTGYLVIDEEDVWAVLETKK